MAGGQDGCTAALDPGARGSKLAFMADRQKPSATRRSGARARARRLPAAMASRTGAAMSGKLKRLLRASGTVLPLGRRTRPSARRLDLLRDLRLIGREPGGLARERRIPLVGPAAMRRMRLVAGGDHHRRRGASNSSATSNPGCARSRRPPRSSIANGCSGKRSLPRRAPSATSSAPRTSPATFRGEPAARAGGRRRAAGSWGEHRDGVHPGPHGDRADRPPASRP